MRRSMGSPQPKRCRPRIQPDGNKPSFTYLLATNCESLCRGIMAALIDAIDVKRKMTFEFENAPYYCMDAEISTPTARGGQTLVRLRMRNMVTRAGFGRAFKAGEKFKGPGPETGD